MKNLWNKFTKTKEELGLPDTLLRITTRLISKLTGDRVFFSRYYVFAQPLSKIVRLPDRFGKNIEVHACDLPLLASRNLDRPKEELKKRFRDGATCLVAVKESKIIATLWFTQQPHDEPEPRITFVVSSETRSAWDFDVFVDPATRGSLAFSKLWSTAAQTMESLGLTTSTSFVWAENDDSIRAHRRLGSYPIFSAYYIRTNRSAMHFSLREKLFDSWRLNGALPTVQLNNVFTALDCSRFRENSK